MSDRVFVDTNILLYSRDVSEPAKQPIAAALLVDLWENRTGRVSVQVLNEYFVNVTRKLDPGLPPEEAWDDVEALMAWNPVSLDASLLSRAYSAYQRYALSWWDSLIVTSAEAAGCATILSEDLSHGASYFGVAVENPFREVSMG